MQVMPGMNHVCAVSISMYVLPAAIPEACALCGCRDRLAHERGIEAHDAIAADRAPRGPQEVDGFRTRFESTTGIAQ